jgi:hypothetical protein
MRFCRDNYEIKFIFFINYVSHKLFEFLLSSLLLLLYKHALFLTETKSE